VQQQISIGEAAAVDSSAWVMDGAACALLAQWRQATSFACTAEGDTHCSESDWGGLLAAWRCHRVAAYAPHGLNSPQGGSCLRALSRAACDYGATLS